MITEAQIRSAIKKAQADGAKEAWLKDGGTRGDGRLGLRVMPTIAEWYAIYYRDAKRRILKIGTYPAVGLADARRKFKEDIGPIISAGGDPEGPRARKRKTDATVLALFTAYVDHLKATASERYAKQARYALIGKDGNAGLAKEIGANKPAGDVEPDDIIPHLSNIHERGSIVMADRVRTIISGAFTYAIESSNSYTRPAGTVNWGVKANPVSAIPRDPEANRVGKRHLSPKEFRDFWKWLETRRETAISSSVLRVMMATGQRETEISGLMDVQFDRAEVILDWSKTKNGLPHAIPLPIQALAVVNEMVPNRAGLLFPSRTKPNQPPSMTAIEKPCKMFAKESGIPHFSPRDLRRTWKTLAGAAGLSKDIRDRIQNHSRHDISSRHYDRYEYMAEKRAAMAQWSAYLGKLLSEGEVVPFPSAPVSNSQSGRSVAGYYAGTKSLFSAPDISRTAAVSSLITGASAPTRSAKTATRLL